MWQITKEKIDNDDSPLKAKIFMVNTNPSIKLSLTVLLYQDDSYQVKAQFSNESEHNSFCEQLPKLYEPHLTASEPQSGLLRANKVSHDLLLDFMSFVGDYVGDKTSSTHLQIALTQNKSKFADPSLGTLFPAASAPSPAASENRDLTKNDGDLRL